MPENSSKPIPITKLTPTTPLVLYIFIILSGVMRNTRKSSLVASTQSGKFLSTEINMIGRPRIPDFHRGTPAQNKSMLYHDALTSWLEAGAQEHLERVHGMGNRQLRRWGDTNAGTIYHHRLVGDHSELCPALDASGFSDLEGSISHHTALSSLLPHNHPDRFELTPPTKVMSTMRRCWTLKPVSDKIVADIEYFLEVLQKVIYAMGCVVPS